MALINEIKEILDKSDLTFDEARAFETGLSMLTDKEQKEFAKYISKDKELIYPLYINFKAKLHAVNGTKEEWEDAVKTEIHQLEEYLTKKRVGDEVSKSNQ